MRRFATFPERALLQHRRGIRLGQETAGASSRPFYATPARATPRQGREPTPAVLLASTAPTTAERVDPSNLYKRWRPAMGACRPATVVRKASRVCCCESAFDSGPTGCSGGRQPHRRLRPGVPICVCVFLFEQSLAWGGELSVEWFGGVVGRRENQSSGMSAANPAGSRSNSCSPFGPRGTLMLTLVLLLARNRDGLF